MIILGKHSSGITTDSPSETKSPGGTTLSFAGFLSMPPEAFSGETANKYFFCCSCIRVDSHGGECYRGCAFRSPEWTSELRFVQREHVRQHSNCAMTSGPIASPLLSFRT